MEPSRDEYVLSVGDLVHFIWRQFPVIALITILLTGVTVGVSLAQPPTYEASIKILIGQERGITEDPGAVVGLQQLSQTMAEAIRTRPVAEAVIRRLDLQVSTEGFLARLSAQQIPNTQFIQVAYVDSSPQRAQQVANTTGEVFAEQITQVTSGPDQDTDFISAILWERAEVPDTPLSPKPLKRGIVALPIGLMLGIGVAFLLEQRQQIQKRKPEFSPYPERRGDD